MCAEPVLCLRLTPIAQVVYHGESAYWCNYDIVRLSRT